MWLIFSKQRHCVPSANFLTAVAFYAERETNPSREQKNATVFANRISWRKITITIISVTEVPQWAKQMCVTKEKNCYSECYRKSFECRPEIDPKYFVKVTLKSGPKPAEKPGPTYNSVALNVSEQTPSNWNAAYN